MDDILSPWAVSKRNYLCMAVRCSHTDTSEFFIDFKVKCFGTKLLFSLRKSWSSVLVLNLGPPCNCVLELLGNCLETFGSCLDGDGPELGFPPLSPSTDVCTFYSVLDALIRIDTDGVFRKMGKTHSSRVLGQPTNSEFVSFGSNIISLASIY